MNLRDALRTRCDQWTANMRRPLTDAQLDAALARSISTALQSFITPDTVIDDAGIRVISDALTDDLEARADDHRGAPFWIVHDSSGVTESDVTHGVSFVIARILIAAETRLLDADAHRFPKLSGLRATPDPDVQGWLDECVRLGTIPASALTRHPELLSMVEPDRFRLMTLADPTTDRGWSADDLARFARGFVRKPEFVDALVRVTVEGVQSAPWVVAVETIKDVREAADGLPWGAAQS